MYPSKRLETGIRAGIAQHRAVVIGAGVGGLAAAIDLAVAGIEVELVERAAAPGGKLRAVEVDGRPLDAGPTVFTMREVFDALFDAAGTSLDAELAVTRAQVLARHAWPDGSVLDLYADLERSIAAVAAWGGDAQARCLRRFSARAAQTYRALSGSFIAAPRPGVGTLMARVARQGLGDLARITPFATLAGALEHGFGDARLRQLFGRYATYCGSSPYLAPATLMLIAHVESAGVWCIEGGMQRLAAALARVAHRCGVRLRYGCEVAALDVRAGAVRGVVLADGERLAAPLVVFNGDVQALSTGLLGADARTAVGAPSGVPSLSALTWNCVAAARGLPLTRHNVLFSSDYAGEFNALFGARRMPDEPTVYVCAQDRPADDAPMPEQAQRLLVLINAPATGDTQAFTEAEVAACAQRTIRQMKRCGLEVDLHAPGTVTTTPRDFARLFPATGGALYGRATHGPWSVFRRPGARSRIPGLYLAGGSVHPGAGVPMAALSGRLAAAQVLADLTSRSPLRRTLIAGGTSTRSAMTATTPSR